LPALRGFEIVLIFEEQAGTVKHRQRRDAAITPTPKLGREVPLLYTDARQWHAYCSNAGT
jgi:hypothetical protein